MNQIWWLNDGWCSCCDYYDHNDTKLFGPLQRQNTCEHWWGVFSLENLPWKSAVDVRRVLERRPVFSVNGSLITEKSSLNILPIWLEKLQPELFSANWNINWSVELQPSGKHNNNNTKKQWIKTNLDVTAAAFRVQSSVKHWGALPNTTCAAACLLHWQWSIGL